MSKRCARCEKAVYPLEELKCLDKIWHKGCFKCQECAMTLSMKTYKGFNKLPYCEAHIPKAKATTVAETPEMRRLAENTKIQSNVQYHADFEKNKAKFTQVADDPETQRLKKNTQIISNVVYHGEMAKKSEMERKRAEPNDENEVHQQPTRRVGSIEDYDPVNEQYGSISQQNANPAGGGYRQETTYQVQRSNMYDQNMGGQQAPPPQMNSNPAHHKVNAPPTQLGRCYRAMYDYEAADTDEVSFKDGDLIINCTAIDEGWMTGTIQRTGVTGMLPANYVERVS
ncbi:LIM and SH3 domain protein 1-like isoform X3 [Eriocheir sinensis]|uniref:LIM and SH3 domain protein 1-like isoform X3 n=1 Tax=Eriocheir sinensis TaxID=95602 RepID=UPI0021C57A1D|nr:LIM and SH3 domain protein 1-like isoform X3 [Eriocheir sinensis]